MLFGCSKNSTATGANPTTAGSPQQKSAAAVANTPAMKQQQSVTRDMNQYWLSHAPPAQKSQIQAAISQQPNGHKP